ncbi:MAG: 3-oxoacyl-[acyl-carrier-protein] reductase [Clostridiales bacterium]|jgi:3-oxoacyl-[acyl-carrier protein] reductase|nr:3-oxoacyl-[acyl-carrier-protein] reductase [Clostridiales bacterium]
MKDRVAVVTGGSRGIGRAICLKFASLGANLVINYAGNTEKAEETKAMCEKLGAKVVLVPGSVADIMVCEKLIAEAVESFGRVDILVNNAGITRDNLIMRMSEEDFDAVIDVNLKGAWNCMKQVSRMMMKQRSGRIVNLSSVVGVVGNAGQVNYAASKAGIIGMTKSLAKELASRGVTVNAVAPGFVQTDMTDVLGEEMKENLQKTIPMGRLGEPEDIANAVVFLAGDEASYITGQVIHVDGGMVM